MAIDRTSGTAVESTASHRTSGALRRARNMISRAPTKGDQVMTERIGNEARVIGRSPGPAHPHHEDEHPERDPVDVVLGLARLDPPQAVARGEGPRAQHVHDAVAAVDAHPAHAPA